jgi:hypothetical protein
MDSQNPNSLADIRSMLDELFLLRTSLASHARERDVAILRLLPADLQEIVASTMREFDEMQESCESEGASREAQIRAATKMLGEAVVGTYLRASYSPGNRKYDLDGLDRLSERFPEVAALRGQGEPVVKILVRTQRKKTAPLLYDTHNI